MSIGGRAAGSRSMGFAIASIIAGLGFTMMLIYLLLIMVSGLGFDWSSLFNYEDSLLGMGGWFVIAFLLTLILSGFIFTIIVGRRAGLKK
jgi:hypothetical protein